MKQIIYISSKELGKILIDGSNSNSIITVNLTKDLKGRRMDADIYLDDSQMKELHRIIVRNNINRRGRDEKENI